jgi:predicted dehydrogenase
MSGEQGAKLRLGVLGCGGMATGLLNHVVAMERAEIAAIFDPDPANLQKAIERFGGEAVASQEAMAARADLDAYLIGSPPLRHAENVLAVAPRGKPIYCEKPLCTTTERCDRMIATCREHGAKLFVGQVLRLFPLFYESKRVLDSGAIGAGRFCSITRSGRGDLFQQGWRLSQRECGGLLMEVNSHELDYLYFLFGEPESVFAQGLHLNGWGDVLDTISVQIRFKNGALGMLHSSNASPIGEYRVHVQATQGNLLHGGFGGELKYRAFDSSETTTLTATDLREKYGDPYAWELRSFFDWIEHDAPPLFTGETGRVNVAMAEAAYRSIESGRPEPV